MLLKGKPVPTFSDDSMLDLTLSMKDIGLTKFLNPYLTNMAPSQKTLLAVSDDIGGSVILDFYYYVPNEVIVN